MRYIALGGHQVSYGGYLERKGVQNDYKLCYVINVWLSTDVVITFRSFECLFNYWHIVIKFGIWQTGILIIAQTKSKEKIFYFKMFYIKMYVAPYPLSVDTLIL